ncbi:Ubiquitin-conjugating enzyme E2 7 [Podila minutissima]|nr:Ubiquitin-conjugating enzyme E2 7 [Podila minutissima]
MSEHATLLLQRQLKELNKHPVEGFSAGLVDDKNFFEWEILIMGPPDTLYEGGFFRAIMTFPHDYPLMPPKLRFTTDMYHPNVYPDGVVCISILHPPGEDKWGYEKASERWLPVHTVETILISVISMLSSPNDESPANIEAAKEWRMDYPSYKKKVLQLTRRSAEDVW